MSPILANSSPPANEPSFAQASVCFAVVILIIATGLFAFAIDLHSLMFLCLLWVGANARLLGYSTGDIREMMSAAITRALPAVYIFILIGMVIASFMHSGTIATLMYYGLDWLSPALFLPVGLLLCAIMSLATGTSWGTAGTLGVVFIGIGEAFGIPLQIVAGMIVCGAVFGDKMSPVSDTTNLAAMSAGTHLYRHIYAMLFTTVPTFVLTFFVFLLIGLGLDEGNATEAANATETIRQALAAHYGLAPLITLIPIIVLAGLSVRQVAAEVAMASSVVAALIVAVLYQEDSLAVVLNALWENTPTDTGVANLDSLLGRGGILSMAWTLILAIMALALGGLMYGTGILSRLLTSLISQVKHRAALVATTILSSLTGIMAMGESYIAIILNCQLFKEKFEADGLDNAILSRTVEEGATLTTPLVPWSTAGAFFSATLGVSVIEYLPWAVFNYLNAFIAIAMAALGIGLLHNKKQKPDS